MARDISIAISAKDNYSQAITTMRNANQAFNKDLSGLTNKLDQLNKTKVSIKVDTDKARIALKDAERQFKATGDAADKLKMELANANYENAKRNLNLVSQNARQAEKDILNLTQASSKYENRASTVTNKNSGLLGAIASSGLTQLIGGSLTNAVSTYVTSAGGSKVGNIFGDTLSTAVSGAAIGSFAGPIGTLVGGLIGGIAGAISGASKNFENKDSAFKDYYKTQYDTITKEQSDSLKGGSDIASGRETDKIAFSTLLGGNKQSDEYLKSLVKFGNVTPFQYEDLTKISRTLLAYSYKQNEILPLLTKVGDTGSALGMSTEDMTWVATSLGRMKSTGKATLEYLNPLLERGIPVWDYLAKSSGKTNKEVQDMVSKGLLPGEKAAEAIADYMGKSFSGNMAKQSETYAGLMSTLSDAQNQLDNAMGQGYNEERKRGIKNQIDYLSGDSGTKMQEAYQQIGEWKASLENLAEKYKRDAITTVMSGGINLEFSKDAQAKLTKLYQEYTQYSASGSEEAGAKMGSVLAEAQAIAQNEYNASQGAQLAIQSNLDLANTIKNDASLNQSYWDAGYKMGEQFSLGLASGVKKKNTAPNSPMDDFGPSPTGSFAPVGKQSSYAGWSPYSNAVGLSYVPYDNYPSLLHEGERVLTASENRNFNKNGNGQVLVTGNNFHIREEADITKVAKEIVNELFNSYQLSV